MFAVKSIAERVKNVFKHFVQEQLFYGYCAVSRAVCELFRKCTLRLYFIIFGDKLNDSYMLSLQNCRLSKGYPNLSGDCRAKAIINISHRQSFLYSSYISEIQPFMVVRSEAGLMTSTIAPTCSSFITKS